LLKVHNSIKDTLDALRQGDGAKAGRKWLATQQAINELPYPQPALKRFMNIVYGCLDDLHTNWSDLNNLQDLMNRVVKNPQMGVKPPPSNNILPY